MKETTVLPPGLGVEELAECLMGVARSARDRFIEGDVGGLHDLLAAVRRSTDEASGQQLHLLEVAEAFLRALSRSDLGTMDLALHRFAAAYPDEAEVLFGRLVDRGRINEKELDELKEPARGAAHELVRVGCLRKHDAGAIDLRPSLRALARDLVSPPIFRHWRAVHEARIKMELGQVSADAQPITLAKLVGANEREAQRHLRAFPLRIGAQAQVRATHKESPEEDVPSTMFTSGGSPLLRAMSPGNIPIPTPDPIAATVSTSTARGESTTSTRRWAPTASN